ncbi:sulfotransferase family protein [Dyella amyloliquefaciens]|uniref:sulfotransferase family protein n=1 Tax=Dyella amyloliquefaciens TaxID=1770545 RepID=UPI00102E8087|nr:sulfotransferase family protein [Dyella amyloliquefaciens]
MQASIEFISSAVREGALAEAERACRELLRKQPQSEPALEWLAYVLQLLHRPAEALGCYRELTERYPHDGGHWSNLATMLRDAGGLEEAERAYLIALRINPEDCIVQGNLGLLYMERGEYVRARSLLTEATLRQPDQMSVRIYAVMACYECGDTLGVEELLAGWEHWPPLTEDLRVDLAWVFAQLGRASEAERLLNETLDTSGQRPRTIARLIHLYERVNRLEEARDLLALLPDPESLADEVDRYEVIAARGVMAQRGHDPAMTRDLLEGLIAQTRERKHRSNLYFGIAKACDKAGDTAAALRALAEAHAVQLENAAQLVPDLLAPGVEPLAPSMLRVEATDLGENDSWRQAGDVATSPVFVVGFPRSGTTMLEQMLDAHPGLASMDERPFMQAVAERLQQHGVLYPEHLWKLSEDDVDELRRYYWQLVSRAVTLAPGQRIVDKNPLNLLHLPLIVRLFPKAPVILALRHPCDVILSCYMQNFRSPGFQVLCSSLDRLARGYVNAMRFWVHHEALLKPPVLRLRYEDLLDDFETMVKRIGDFIGVEDATPLLRFHEHAQQKGFISTPSYSQVTQPPNKRAVGRWKRYADAFEALRPTLAEVVELWGYEF